MAVDFMAEQAVLGALLIDPEIVPGLLAAVAAEDFQLPSDRQIFDTVRELYRTGAPVDPVSIRDRIGPSVSEYMAQLMEITPTATNWREYAQMAHGQAQMARAKALSEQITAAGTLEECRPLCAALGQLLSDGRRLSAWTVPEMLQSFCESQDPERPAAEYISSGLSTLDEGIFVERGDVVILGGYPSDGKTALALQMAWHMAGRYRVGFFSLETARRKLRDRLISHAMGFPFSDIKRRSLSEEAWNRLAREGDELGRRDLTVVEATGMTAADIEAASRAYGFEIIFVDYVQLIIPESGGKFPRSEQMAGVSRTLHTFAQRTGTLVVELGQLARQERGKWAEPTMHDLKESGQFEQDADVVLLLFRPGPQDGLDQESYRILKVGKNKEGRWGSWPLRFDGERQIFSVMPGEAVRKAMVAAGRKAKQRTKADKNQMEFHEIEGTADMPF